MAHRALLRELSYKYIYSNSWANEKIQLCTKKAVALNQLNLSFSV